MINRLPPIPSRFFLTDAQRRAARGALFVLPGYGEVEYRGSCPLGEPRVVRVIDRMAEGTFTLPPRDALDLARKINAAYDGQGRVHEHLWTPPTRRTMPERIDE